MENQSRSIYTYPVVNRDSHKQVTQWMAIAVRSCSRNLLPWGYIWRAEMRWRQRLHAACHWARSLPPHCTPEDNMWAELNTGSGLFVSLLHKCYAIYLVESSPIYRPSPHPTPHALFRSLSTGWNELRVSWWKHGCWRATGRKMITQITGTTATE